MQYNDLMNLWKQFQGLEKGVPQSHYTRKIINFEESRNQGEVVIKVYGDYINKSNYTGNVGDATIRISSRNAAEIPITEFKKSKGVFNNIYIKSTDTTGYFIFYVGGAWSGEIETAAGDKVGLLTSSGVSINPVRDERFKVHTFVSRPPETCVANTARPLTNNPRPCKWAIIHTLSKVALIGDSTVTRGGGANDGQKYGEDVYISVEYVNLGDIYIINYAVDEQCVYTINYVAEEA